MANASKLDNYDIRILGSNGDDGLPADPVPNGDDGKKGTPGAYISGTDCCKPGTCQSSIGGEPGQPGNVGKKGKPGAPGSAAPPFVLVYDSLTGSSVLRIISQSGNGGDGGSGSSGGKGGNGGSAPQFDPSSYITQCLETGKTFPVSGGNGGNGGNGGDGGDGGAGADGSEIVIHFGTTQGLIYAVANGGIGGAGGTNGEGGPGGFGGLNEPILIAGTPTTQAPSGTNGAPGLVGKSGYSGQVGTVTLSKGQI